MTQETTPVKKKKGGPQPGSGRPKGRLNNSTLDAMQVKKAYQERIRRNADKLFNAQFSLAQGVQMLFVIHTDSKGVRRKPEMVTDANIITRFLDEHEGGDGVMKLGTNAENSKVEDYFFLTTKVPDSRTISDMLDRAMGKPDQSLDLTSSDGSMTPTVIIESTYGNKPNFRPDNSVTEADGLAEDSSEQSS